MLSRTVLVIALVMFAAPIFTQEEDTGPWSGKANLGYLATSGNTDNSNLNSGFEVGYAHDLWAHLFSASAISANESNASTAEAYELGWKSERSISESDYLFGRLDWRKDRFSSYDSQFSQSIGYGRRLIDLERRTLNGEFGIGARQSDLIDGTSTSETILRGGLDYIFAISETAEFRQGFTVEAGDENTYGESVTALAAKLRGDLALVASYTVKHNTDVLPGLKKTDTYSALTLEYVF